MSVREQALKNYALAIAEVDCPWCTAKAGIPCPAAPDGCHMTRLGRLVNKRQVAALDLYRAFEVLADDDQQR